MLCVWVQLLRQSIQFKCRSCRSILYLIIVNMESRGADHDRLQDCESKLRLRILDRVERRPNRPCHRGDCRFNLCPKDNELLQPYHFDVLSHHINIRSLHHDHNSSGRTRGRGDELRYLFIGIQNHSRGECWYSYTNRELLRTYQRGWKKDVGPGRGGKSFAGGYELFCFCHKNAVVIMTGCT